MIHFHRWLATGLVFLCHFAQAHEPREHAFAFGQPGDAKKVSRTVEITMNDAMRFTPSSVSVSRNETIRFVLTPDAPTKITWGFDVAGNRELRSFNSTSPKKAKGSDSLPFRVELDSEQVEFLGKVDEQMKALFCEDATWVPVVVKNDKHEKPTVKINVCLSGADADLTSLKIKRGDVVEKGRGWDFLKTAADMRGSDKVAFTGAEVKIVAKLRAWKMKGQSDCITRAGISLAATQLFIRPMEREIIEEADVLEDW